MKKILLVIFLTLISQHNFYSQNYGKLGVVFKDGNSAVNIKNVEGDIFFTLSELLKILNFEFNYIQSPAKLEFFINKNRFIVNAGIPFIKITDTLSKSESVYQLSRYPSADNMQLFLPLNETIELLNKYIEEFYIHIDPARIQILNRRDLLTVNADTTTFQQKSSIILRISEDDEKSVITISSTNKTPSFSNFFSDNKLHLILWDVLLKQDSVFYSQSSKLISKVEVIQKEHFAEFIFHLSATDIMAYYEKGETEKEFNIFITEREYGEWYVRESENFRCIYRDSHSHLINHIIQSAEQSLRLISRLFNYNPSEKIVINTYDVSDYGFGGTTSIPLNFIRLEIEPIEPGYEVVPYNERFQWLISHELVHIAYNDAASGVEEFFRSVFSKVNPEKNRPLTILFSLLTGKNRYSPRWHQEAPAVYFETWLSGGFGRVLGNFDEMYFRTLVYQNLQFPDAVELDGKLGHESFLIETLYYIYGGRFITHLAIKYGNEKVLNWLRTDKSDFYSGFKGRFQDAFNIDFDDAWRYFILDEIEFQKNNINILERSELSPVKKLTEEAFGFITEPYYSSKTNKLIFGYHRAHELATLKQFNLNDFKNSEQLVSLPTPSSISVASTAYNDKLDHLFYTTNNNQLYRDIRLYDLKNGSDKMLFEDSRTGHLTVSPKTDELWGVQHNAGNAILVKSVYPYDILETVLIFEVGDEIQQLSINNNGDYLAAVLHKTTGQQSIIISDVSSIDKGGVFQFNTITASGSPENPYWSSDDKYLFWNAYTNGVSNIYRCNLETGDIVALSHSITGLFKPVFLSSDTLAAFQFTSKGFIPVLIPNKPAEKLPAINYLGQKVLTENSSVINWSLSLNQNKTDSINISEEIKYNSLNYLKINTFIPVISGFQNNIVLGFYSQIADPLLKNEISIEAGISPFKETDDKIRFHAKFKYDFHQRLYIAAEHNPQDFFDLFNKRKRGTLGNRFAIGHNDYWLYDNPVKIKQSTELSYYTDTRFINDNLVEVSEPDFLVFRTEFDYRNLRRSIGSFDYEHGNQLRFHLLAFGAALDKFETAPSTYLEWDNYSLYLFSHNVLRLKLAAGYHYKNDNIFQAKFFFGGFGNREVENVPVRQYENVFRFPGIPIYSIATDNFIKLMISNIFPPIRFNSPEFLEHYIKNINLSIFSQGLVTDLPEYNTFLDAGAQLNIMFSHWYNLESTISAGIAKAWWNNQTDWEWFVSYKLLRD